MSMESSGKNHCCRWINLNESGPGREHPRHHPDHTSGVDSVMKKHAQGKIYLGRQPVGAMSVYKSVIGVELSNLPCSKHNA
jgi:hypothetical protein